MAEPLGEQAADLVQKRYQTACQQAHLR
jgi:hypothetical protein